MTLPDGALEELGENICMMNTPGQADKHVKTMEAIAICIVKSCTHGADTKKAIANKKEFDFDKEKPTTTQLQLICRLRKVLSLNFCQGTS